MGKCLSKPQDLLDSKSHTFKTKVFKHPNSCQVCNEVIWNEGRKCRVCKFACHRKCEYKVSVTCEPSINYDLPSNGNNNKPQQTQLKSRSVTIDSNKNKMTAHIHAEISQRPSGGDAYMRYSFDLDVDYITERLIAGGLEAQYRSNLRDVVRMLKSKHQDKYVIFNLSQRRHDINQLNPQVYDLGWPDHLAPSLEKLCSICKHIETWLKQDPHRVVVLHCKGGRGPIGVVVLAYMNYINITSNSETAMDRYAMKRFLEAKTESAMQPSQHRYVNYFTGLLMKSIQVNRAPLFLHHVLIHGVPNYDINGGCRPFLKVYQGMQPIFTSGVYSVPEGTGRFAITLDQALPIRGDILVKCYHKKFRATSRDVIFRCQFHTTAIMECRLVYQKADLDDACTDARFPDFTKVEFVFSHTPDQLHGSDYVAGSNFPVDDTDDPLNRWDSYENFDTTIDGGDYSPEVIDLSVSMNNNITHTSAPDGSLYAEVQKTPSPVQHDEPFFGSPHQAASVSPASVSPASNQLMPLMPPAVGYDTGPRSPMQTTQLAVLRAKMNSQSDPGYQTNVQRTPSPRTPTSDPPSPMQPHSPLIQLSNGPQRPTELLNGPKAPETSSKQKRAMNYKEKRDLDDLLRGIEDVTVISSPDSAVSGQEVVEKRKIVDVQAQMSQLPPLEHSTPRMFHHQPHNRELENPYAEITDAVPKSDMSDDQHKLPVEENISFSHIEKVESLRLPDFEEQRTPQLHDNPTYAVTNGNDQYLPSNTPHRTQDAVDLGNDKMSGQQINASTPYQSISQQQDIWRPQPLRAKKEQLVFIYKEDPTSPRGTTVSPPTRDNSLKQPEQVEPPTRQSAGRTSAEIEDDAMTWLQRQQQKLKVKREREGAVVHPIFQTPKRELPKVPEQRHDPSSLPKNDNVREAMIQPQTQIPREEIPTEMRYPQTQIPREEIPTEMRYPQTQIPREEIPPDNLSWLEQKQRKLQMKRGQEEPTSKPLFIDTSHQVPSYGLSFSPPRTDSSGLSANSAASDSSHRPQVSDMEKTINQLSNMKSPNSSMDPGPLTPPHTYEHESLKQFEMWQTHQRPLNRQSSDITYDREKPIVIRRQEDTEQAPKLPAYGMGDGVTSLPPAGPHSSTHKESAGSCHHHSTSPYVSQDCQTLGQTLGGSHPPVTSLAVSAHGLSRDSGYASSLSSTVTKNEPIETANVTRVIGTDGSETTTTTTTQSRKKIIHVFPQKSGFDVKQLPTLFMEEIKKDGTGGLQNRLLGLMKDKGIGESPTLKRKQVAEPGPQLTDYSWKQSVVNPVLQKGQAGSQNRTFLDEGGSLKTAACRMKKVDSSHGSYVRSHKIPPQNTLLMKSTQMRNDPFNSDNTSLSTNSSLTSSPCSQYTPSHPPISSPRMSSYHSLPRSRMMNSSNGLPRVHDPNSNPYSHPHDLTNHTGNFLAATRDHKTKPSKSFFKQVRSQSLPRNQTFKNCDNFQEFNSPHVDQTGTSISSYEPHYIPPAISSDPGGQLARSSGASHYHSLPKDQVLGLTHGHSYMHDPNPIVLQSYNRSEGNQASNHETTRFKDSTPQSIKQPLGHHSLPRDRRRTHDTMLNAGPKPYSTAELPYIMASTPNHANPMGLDTEPVEPFKPPAHDERESMVPQADPAPFIDVTLVQPVPSYNWVMKRIQALRNTSLNNLNHLSSSKEYTEIHLDPTRSRFVNTGCVEDERHTSREPKRHEQEGLTDCERVRGHSFGRYRHRSEEGGRNQNHDVWLRRDDYDSNQKEQQTVSADRARVHSSMDHHSHSKRTDLGQHSAGHPVGSNNIGTIPVQHLRTNNHSPTLSNANHYSGVTGVTQGMPEGQTNPSGNINLMAGLEDAIRMLSEWTHLQNKDPTTISRSTTKHNKHVIDVHRDDDVTGQQRQINVSNGRIGSCTKYQSNTQPRHQVPTQSLPGPAKNNMSDTYQKVDLHIDESSIEEPLNLEGRVADRIADLTSKMSGSDEVKSQPPTGPHVTPSKAKQVTRRTPQQSGYDSDSAVQQYYSPTSQRVKEASAERWLQNPGGVPVHESAYWNKTEGLTSPNLKEQWTRKPEYDVASSSESLQNGSVTPRFPVGPRAYKNMVSTPIAVVGRPPHGPDAPYPLSPIKRDDRDVLDTTGLNISPSQQMTSYTARPMNVDAPVITSARTNTPTTSEVIIVTQKRIIQTERLPDQNGLVETPAGSTFKEAVPQQPIMAKVERVPTPVSQVEMKVEKRVIQNGQHYPVEAKVERVPVTNYSIQESDTQAKPVNPQYPVSGFPPPKKEVTFQDARGGVPERPTGPQALAGTKDTQSLIEEYEIIPTVKKPVEIAPTWPIELEVRIKNEGMGPAVGDVQVKRGAALPPDSPQQLSPSTQNITPSIQEPTIVVERIKVEQVQPDFSQQMLNLSSQPPPPQYPTYSDRMKNRPPGPLYPTFSDRHRKAAAGRLEEVPPQVANGYQTMYDNRGASKTKRASTGSDGIWPVHSTHQRKASDCSASATLSGRTTPSNFYLMQHPSPYSSALSLVDTSVDKVRFVKDLSAWWYKPHISRDEAIAMLRDKCPGQFVVRDSNSFPGAFGLAVKVAQLPPNTPPSKKATDPASELVRHFLIEPNPRGVRLKGCPNEPIFGSLSALIYQHTLTQLALPCKLQLPESDPTGVDSADSSIDPKSAHALLSQGAACNVLYLATMDMESLTGTGAVREATSRMLKLKDKPKRIVVHFKVSLKGITLTDNHRKLFFRRHYPVKSVLYCGMDSGSRKWKRKDGTDEAQSKIFGFVNRKPGSMTDNQCHLFAEYEIEQPASAIVSFVTKVLLGSSLHS